MAYPCSDPAGFPYFISKALFLPHYIPAGGTPVSGTVIAAPLHGDTFAYFNKIWASPVFS
jgi:hypothetical protein